GFLRVDAPVGQLAIVVVFGDIEVHAAAGFIGEALVDQFFDHLDLFGNVAAGTRRNVGTAHAKPIHRVEVGTGVRLDNLHRQRLRLLRLPQNAILAGVEHVADI